MASWLSAAQEGSEMAARDGITPLADLDGSDDNVLVRAAVTYIIDLNAARPFQKGWLYDRSLGPGEKRPFVVYDPDLRLEKGGYYLLNGCDYWYDDLEEIQLLLDQGAYVERLDTDNK